MIEGFVNNPEGPEGQESQKKNSKILTILFILLIIFVVISVILLIFLVFYIKSKTISDEDEEKNSEKTKESEESEKPNRLPRIGIAQRRVNKDETMDASIETQIHYIEAIEKAGGVPLSLPILNSFNSEVIKSQIEAVDGIIIQGGLDVNPALYNEERDETVVHINEQTDDYLIEVIKQAEIRKIPILGICRGLQILNVYYGGSLYQDIKYAGLEEGSHLQDDNDTCLFKHNITIEENSYLKEMFPNYDTLYVNSFHHQAIKDLGKNLAIDARAPDGIIESIHLKDDNHWVFGLQFHPEQHLRCNNFFMPIFDTFIEQAKKKIKN